MIKLKIRANKSLNIINLKKYCTMLPFNSPLLSTNWTSGSELYPKIIQYLTVVLITANSFSTPKKPTLVFFYVVLCKAKLHSESKYDENLEKIESLDFLFFISLSFYPSSDVDFSPNIWMVPESLLQASQLEFKS